MAEPPSSKKAQPPLVDNILQYGKQAFDPELTQESRNENMSKFVELMERFVSSPSSEIILTFKVQKR